MANIINPALTVRPHYEGGFSLTDEERKLQVALIPPPGQRFNKYNTPSAEETAANAKLLAAAPRMLDALRMAHAQYVAFVSQTRREGVDYRFHDRQLAIIEETIRTAEGK